MHDRSLRYAVALGAALLSASCAAGTTTTAAPVTPSRPAAAAAAAGRFAYAPTTAQYRITSSMKGAQELMGQRQEMTSSSNQLVTVTIDRVSEDTLQVTTRVDSIAVVGPMGMTPPGLNKLPGTKVVAKIAPTGQVYAVTTPAPDSLPMASELTYEMSNILPKVRGTIARGSTWTDTTARKVSQGGLDIDRQVIATYTVAGDTTIDGTSAWKIGRTARTTLSGSGTQGGQPMTLDGSSDGNGTMYVTSNGGFLGYTNEEQVSIKVVMAANGMEVGITQNATTKVEKVR